MITPDMVVESYRKSGLSPSRGFFFQNTPAFSDDKPYKQFACGMTAIAVANRPGMLKYYWTAQAGGNVPSRGYVSASDVTDYIKEHFGVTPEYISGFMVGFDGTENQESLGGIHIQGFKDGRAAWEAVQEEILGKDGSDYLTDVSVPVPAS